MNRPLILVAARDSLICDAVKSLVQIVLRDLEADCRLETLPFSTRGEFLDLLESTAENSAVAAHALVLLAGEGHELLEQAKYIGKDSGLLAEAVLSFPEMRIEPLPREDVAASSNSWLKDLLEEHANGRRLWFDPLGNRQELRKQVQLSGESPNPYRGLWQRRCSGLAWVIDDELDHRWLNGYTMYRLGYRVECIGTDWHFRCCLKSASTAGGQAAKPSFVLADWQLEFPDLQAQVVQTRGSTLQSYAAELSVSLEPRVGLAPSRLVVLTSSGERVRPDIERAFSAFAPVVLSKPIGGALQWSVDPRLVDCRLRERADPSDPKEKGGNQKNDTVRRHSLPYACQRIAERLLTRSFRMASSTAQRPMQAHLLAALLAGEAKELLGDRARSLAQEALANQVFCEESATLLGYAAQAEAGVSEVVRHLESASLAILTEGGVDSSKAQRSFMLSTLRRLRKLYADHGQADAADHILRVFSHREAGLPDFSFRIWRQFTQHARVVVRPISRYFAWYAHVATAGGTSVGRLSVVSATWVFAFACVFYFSWPDHFKLVAAASGQSCSRMDCATSFFLALLHSLANFLQFSPGLTVVDDAFKLSQPPAAKASVGYLTLAVTETAIAVVHLGLLISLLYRRIARNVS